LTICLKKAQKQEMGSMSSGQNQRLTDTRLWIEGSVRLSDACPMMSGDSTPEHRKFLQRSGRHRRHWQQFRRVEGIQQKILSRSLRLSGTQSNPAAIAQIIFVLIACFASVYPCGVMLTPDDLTKKHLHWLILLSNEKNAAKSWDETA
jgi:hypothetical protein